MLFRSCDCFPLKSLPASVIASITASLNEVNLGFITLDLIGNENAILISGFKAFGYATERYSPVLIDSACKTEPKYV